MKAHLKRKSTRTVHGDKVVRLRLDIPYSEMEEAEEGDQDLLKWLDNHVDVDVSFSIGPFEDEQQEDLTSISPMVDEPQKTDQDILDELEDA